MIARGGVGTNSGFDLAISYDSTKFTIATAGAATIGSLLTPASGNLIGTPLGITYNAATPGIIRLQASTSDGTRTLPFGTTGSIVLLRATLAAGATGTTIINVLASSGGTSTAIADNDVNSLVLVPAPSNANTDTIDGLLTITVATLPTLLPTVINAGAGFITGSQRSEIVSLTVSFSAAATLGANAFTLRNKDTNSVIDSSQIIYAQGTSSSFVITFGAGSGANGVEFNGVVKRAGGSNGSSIGNSLADGNYELTVDPTKVLGNNVFGNALTDNFFRLFGDANGSGVVDGLDNALLRQAIKSNNPNANAVFDVDGNGGRLEIATDIVAFGFSFNKRRRVF